MSFLGKVNNYLTFQAVVRRMVNAQRIGWGRDHLTWRRRGKPVDKTSTGESLRYTGPQIDIPLEKVYLPKVQTR